MKKAFTLVELIVALVVLSIGLITLLSVLRNVSLNNANAHFVTVAGLLAEGKIEEMLGDRISGGFASVNDTTEIFGSYTIDVNVDFVALSNLNTPTGLSDYKRIEVTVTKDAASPTVTLVTLVSNY